MLILSIFILLNHLDVRLSGHPQQRVEVEDARSPQGHENGAAIVDIETDWCIEMQGKFIYGVVTVSY